ncbi:OsmC family protein [Tepidibacter aestuarii]|uniref:OsmC family protein n=1 Tax=Tepidibacter aestuarii TaxID=2925782 RepID=UPI0020C050E1|nr:OsmC family protein [Tepidibacter aestuarii]
MKITKYLLIGFLVISLGLVGCSQAESSQDTNKDQMTTEATETTEKQDDNAELTTLKAVVRSKGGLKVEAESRGFKIVMDEPTEEGGTNQGMNPCEAVLSAFGGCQTIVAVAYAEEMGIDLQDYWVELEGDFDMRGFGGVEGVFPGYTEVRYKIHIKSDSPQEKINEFISYVEKVCPVGNTIASPVKMVRSDIVVEK